MKPFITALIFGLFLISSAYLSENTLEFFKANKHNFSQNENLSFVYGWVKAKGKEKSKFFIQEGYQTGSCPAKTVVANEELEKEVNVFLNTHFPDLHLVRVTQAGCFDNIGVLNSEKQRLMKNKKQKDVLKLPIVAKQASLIGF